MPAPEFSEEDKFTRIILYLLKSLREMDKKDKVRYCYQHCSLKYVPGSIMTNQTLKISLELCAIQNKTPSNNALRG